MTRAAVGVLAVLISFSGCFFLPREQEMLPPPLVEPQQAQYRSVEVQRGDIERSVRVVGNLVSTRQSQLSFPERGGYLKGLYVRVGDQVRPGQLLAELDTNELESMISQEELNIALYEDQLENLTVSAELEIALEDLTLAELEQEHDLAQQLGDRPRRELEAMQRAVEKQKIRRDLSVAGHMRNRMNTSHSLQLSRIRLEEYRRQLVSSRLYAPIGGLVVFLDTSEEGRYIQARQPFIRISSPESLIVQYTGREHQSFSRGMEVEVSVLGEDYRGQVVSTPRDVPTDQYQAYRESVQFRVDGLPADIGEGSAADIFAVIARREGVLLLPKSAIQRFQTRRFVRLLEDGVIREQDVSLGLESDRFFEIRDGLEEGWTVLY